MQKRKIGNALETVQQAIPKQTETERYTNAINLKFDVDLLLGQRNHQICRV